METLGQGIAPSGPRVAAALVVAAIIGFALGTWFGNATKSATASSLEPKPAVVVASTPSVSPTAAPTEPPASSRVPAGPQQVILTLDGDSHEVTDAFEVKPGWQIQWQIDGSSIAIAATGETNLGVLVDKPGPASGVNSVAQGGVFRLEIAANGPWTITVIDGEEPPPS